MAIVASLLLAVIVAVLTLSPVPVGVAGISHLDKLAHVLAFAAVAAPLAWRFPRWWWVVALGGLAYGGMIEIVQPLTGRSAEWGDFLADGIGALAGAGLAFAGKMRFSATPAVREPPVDALCMARAAADMPRPVAAWRIFASRQRHR